MVIVIRLDVKIYFKYRNKFISPKGDENGRGSKQEE